jgi:amino acid adenylation domain-containing protein
MDEHVFAMSFGQERLWFLDQLEPGTAAYNLPRVFRISGVVNVTALSKAVQAIVARQESLRTVFTLAEGEPKQVVLPSLEIDLPVNDLSGLPESEREQEALRMAAEEARKPFNLESGPLVRILLVRLRSDEHTLVLIMHHIITDGWSMNVMFRELAELYDSFAAGREPQLSPLPVQYSDFSQWQRKNVTSEFLASQSEYWKRKLQGAETILDLQTDFDRPPSRSGHGKTKSLRIDQKTTEKLKTLGRSEGATLFMTLFAAFQTLLWRHTSQDSILVGTPIAGRAQVEFENIIGFFVNTLVLRADFPGNCTFRELVRQIRTTCLEAYTNQDMPFEKLVEELQPERAMSRTPLVQVMFVFHNVNQSLEMSELDLEEIEFESGIAKFDLTLEIVESSGLYCTFEYDSDLFYSETIERMAGHFEQLVHSTIDDPNKQLSKLQLLTQRERRQLQSWNNTTAKYPKDVCIHTVFEQQAARTPDAVALCYGGAELTYRQLNEQANSLAHRLMREGVKPGTLVGVLFGRSLEMVIGLLGILKAGAAYVPLAPSQQQARLAFLIEDSQVGIVVARTGDEDKILGSAVKVVPVEIESSPATWQTSNNPSVPLSAESRAYVIYTSGSTGTPKGVEGTHRASLNRFSWMWDVYPFRAGETCCQKTDLSFVDSIWEIFGPLLRGVRNVIIPDQVLRNPEQLIQTLAQNHVTRIVLVPSLLRVLLDYANDLQARLPEAALWSCSGEVLSVDLARRFSSAVPNAKLLNIYGSSEVAADVAWHEVQSDSKGSSVPLGRPIHNCQLFLLDPCMNPVPIGVRGEICVGGDCLALGYWRRPELTSERFVPSPFKSSDSPRLYKTGDLARYLPDGDIEFLGRADNQVKISGMRVELGEIEAALNSHPQIREAVVTVTSQSLDRYRLVAYFIARDGRPSIGNELQRFLRSNLPDHMIPSDFLLVDAFPLLPSGKVNRKALSSMAAERIVAERTFVAPRTETEEKLTQIWREVLSIDQVGVEDNFFDIGGHSLIVIQVIARIRKVLDVEVPFRTLFEEPTIAALADQVNKAIGKGLKARTPILARRKDLISSNREALLAQLNSLSTDEVNELLKQIQQGKLPKEL